MPINIALEIWKQEDQEFKVILRHKEFRVGLGRMRPCLETNNSNNNEKTQYILFILFLVIEDVAGSGDTVWPPGGGSLSAE